MSLAYEEKARIIQSRTDLSEDARRMEIERLIDVAKGEYSHRILLLKAQLPRGLGLFLSDDKKRSRKKIRHAIAMLEIAKRNEILSLAPYKSSLTGRTSHGGLSAPRRNGDRRP
jgi:hypothetical protein